MTPDRFQRLKNAIEPSLQKLKPARVELSRVVRQYVGSHYFEGAAKPRPLNTIEMAVTTYLEALSSRNPQVLCVTHDSKLRPAAAEYELAINEQLKRMGFAVEHRLWVLSALFSVGIMKVGLEVTDNAVVDDEELTDTDIFCEAIMLDDWVHDMTAAKWNPRQVTFCGNRYRMSLEKAKRNPNFDREAREALSAKKWYGQEDRVEQVSKGQEGYQDQFTDMTDLWDIWVPEDGEIVTFAADSNTDRPLRTVKWNGPKHGPYRFLGFNPVLNNIMPLAPCATWVDLDDLVNRLYVQLGKQASRQKTILLTTVQGVPDGERIRTSADGEIVVSDNPQHAREVRMGGMDNQTLGFAQHVRQMVSWLMGNLDAIAGLGQQAGTLGQEQIIKDASSERMRAMQTAVAAATRAVVEDIAFWMFKHPTLEMQLTRSITGTDLQLEVPWPYQEDENGNEVDVRQGEFDKYKISVQPYSFQDISPGQRAQFLRSLWREDILPLIQLGVQPDVNKYLLLLSRYMDLPELTDIVPSTQLANMEQQEGMRKPAATSREYVRKNVSAGRTPQAEQQFQAQQLMEQAPTGEM